MKPSKPVEFSTLIAGREIVPVDLDSVVLDPANARSHGPDSIRVIKDSLQLFGQTEPIGIQASTRKVIWGNGRVEAMREMGWTQAGAIVLSVDNTTAAALSLALNRTAERSEWDTDVLAANLAALDADSFDVGLLGWDQHALDVLLGKSGQGVDDPQAEWKGMPEFEHEDLTAVQSIHVHFKTYEDVQAFAELVGQKITDKTRSIWCPQQEIIRYGEAE